MDMDLPILDILQGVKDSSKFQYVGWGDKELWAREIERAATGYLELQAEGRAAEFELERLAEILPKVLGLYVSNQSSISGDLVDPLNYLLDSFSNGLAPVKEVEEGHE
jgi:hypothetical protein